jgi:glyoxylase-like metal-dependent hydrolase (beta-lactamase superfamily II)
VCFYLPARGLLFSGDTVLLEIFPHIGYIEGHDCFGDFLLALERLQALPGARVLPAHGQPFDGLDAWCLRTRAEALRRLERVRSLAAAGLNPAQIVDRIWQRDLRAIDYQLALTSVLAQLAWRDRPFTEQTAGHSRLP